MEISKIEPLGSAAFLFRGALAERAREILDAIERISRQSPFRRMETRRGAMSVEMTNCGEVGWLTDRRGYRYTQLDPLTGQPWPEMPDWLQTLATGAAARAGSLAAGHGSFANFRPNACLINKYVSGTRLGMHVDNDEADTQSPIVSFSFGVPAVFRWGGLSPRDTTTDYIINHGDVLVWGGTDRLRYHGITKVYDADLASGMHERLVLTFRHTNQWKIT